MGFTTHPVPRPLAELVLAMLVQSQMSGWSSQRKQAAAAKQGLPLIFTDLRIVDQEGRELPRDGRHMGELQARGAHTTRAYLKVPIPACSVQYRQHLPASDVPGMAHLC